MTMGSIFGAILIVGCIAGGIILMAILYHTLQARRQYDKTVNSKVNWHE